jgi:hypothetical protein
MGAERFLTEFDLPIKIKSSPAGIDDAFDAAVLSAQYDHGHAGYTGTIAEKTGWRWACKLPAGVSSEDAMDVLEHLVDHQADAQVALPTPRHPRLTDEIFGAVCELLGGRRDGIVDAYQDKWGPAVCFEVEVPGPDRRFAFMGWASS